jgi:CHAT domain-containing protein/Tfp pilus assembly protein PilF
MAPPLSPSSIQTKYYRCVVYSGLILFITLLPVQIQASPLTRGAGVASFVQEDQQARRIEPGEPIERELAGGQSHFYQIALADGQYVNLVVDQRGIDVVLNLFGPDGKQIMEFDSESRPRGRESASLVAEAAGDYRLSVQPKLKRAAAGSYEVRIGEMRAATENDRALQEARKQYTESVRLTRAGKYSEAQSLAERALEIRQKALGPEHPDVARSIHSLADLYREIGEYAKAGPLYQSALKIRQKVFGLEHPEVASSLNGLATLHLIEGDFVKAEPLLLQTLEIRQKVLDPEHPDIAECLNSLANLYADLGGNARAEPFYQRAMDIWEKAFGPEDHTVSRALNNLAIIYQDMGEYAKAEPLYQRSLAIKVKTLGPEHPDVAQSLNNFANFYTEKGDYVKSESMHKRALEIREKTLGPEHPNIAQSLNNLANVYNYLGDFSQAAPLYKKALTIQEKTLGPEHSRLAITLNGLANLYRNHGRYAEAEEIYQRAVAIRESALGPEHPDTANSLDNLAILHWERGNYAKAESLYQRVIKINERALGPEHPFVGATYHALALVYAAKGDLAESIRCISRAVMISERNIALNLATGSERQKLAYLALYERETDFTHTLCNQAAKDNPQALDLAFTTLLRRKGRGLDAMTDTIAILRRHAAPQDQKLFDRLVEARSQLATLTLRGSSSTNPDTYPAQLKTLGEKVEELESSLITPGANSRSQKQQPVTLSTVQAALPPGSVLIEFAIHTPRHLQTGKSEPLRYLAYLLAAQGPPRWVDLGEAATIDRAVADWRKALRNPNQADVKQLGRLVDEKVMQPVRSLMDEMPGEIHGMLIAPDGSLNLIPFAALVDEQNRYLVERYSIIYLTSGRDLLQAPEPRQNSSAALIVANPAFGRIAGDDAQAELRSANSRAGNQGRAKRDLTITFHPLPGTEGEAVAIKSLVPDAKMLLWERATEASIKKVKAPRILHIATHGFFFSDQAVPPVETSGLIGENPLRMSDLRLNKWAAHIKDPLLRSGLALAGANQGKSDGDDGLLTALEVAGLDLWGTDLVVLSACDTGVGEVKNGDGVHGLRRALVLAGSETQIMSLWPVSDRITRELMVAYYNGLKQRQGRGESLRRVQLRMLKNVKRQHPFYWAAFIQSGEWANLEGRR